MNRVHWNSLEDLDSHKFELSQIKWLASTNSLILKCRSPPVPPTLLAMPWCMRYLMVRIPPWNRWNRTQIVRCSTMLQRKPARSQLPPSRQHSQLFQFSIFLSLISPCKRMAQGLLGDFGGALGQLWQRSWSSQMHERPLTKWICNEWKRQKSCSAFISSIQICHDL